MKTDLDNLVLNETPDAIIVATPDGTVASWSRSAEAAFGFNTHTIIERPAESSTQAELDTKSQAADASQKKLDGLVHQ